MTRFFEFFFQPPKPKVDLLKEKRQISSIAWGILSLNVFSLLAQIVLIVLLAPFLEHPAFGVAVGSISMYLIAQPLSMLFFNRCEVSVPAEKKKLSFLQILGLISISMTLTLAGSVIGTFVTQLIAILQGTDASNPVADATQATPLWAIILFMVIMAPICEELLFRRVIIDRLRRYGDLPAILISGVIFGVIHGNFSQLFYATLLGFFFGFIYVKTGKLRYTIFLHVFINFMGGAYPTIMERLAGGELPSELTPENISVYLIPILMMLGLYALYLLSVIGVAPSAIAIFGRLKGKTEAEVPLTGAQARRIVFKNFAFWTSVLALILLFVLNTVSLS
ncbi:MAG: CPBP family intramembrane metalloprotease [Ruminococcaceae bacterium]|nr:CPBP family intramembrane metalloprotease [Oscillospiraceae bacterium]